MYKNYISLVVGRDAQLRTRKRKNSDNSQSKWLLSMMLLFGMLFTGFSVSAQNPLPYTFSQASGTYVPLVGGTSFQNGITAVNTNAVSAQITIPFTFNFNGTNYTSLVISNNGFVTFGTTLPAIAAVSPISITTAYDGAICGYGINLAASAVSGAAPDISYGMQGADFVVQYTDVARSGIGGDRMSFQIRLTQTTNAINIVYNNWAATTTTTSVANFGQVGLRGLTNSAFLNRMVYATAPYNTWATSGGGADNGSTPLQAISTAGPGGPNCMRYNNAYLPANGLTYTFTPVQSSFYQGLPYTQNFETWSNLQSVKDVPGAGVITNPATGNQSPRAHNETLANSAWGSSSGGSLATPGTAQGSVSSRFHCFDAGSGFKGYMDFYLNFSSAGAKTATFDMINTGTTRNLRVYLSTNGGVTFGAALATYNTSIATWTNQSVALGSSTSATCVLRFEYTSDYGSGNPDIGLDNLSVTSLVAPGCTTPTALASSLVFSSVTSTSLSGSFTAASPAPSKYLVVRSTSATAPTPANGTPYTIGSTALGGTTNVRLAANATSFTDSGLTAGTQYYYHVFSYNDNCTGEPFYSATAYTLGQITPCAAATSVSNDTVTNNSANITWTGAGSYIVEYGASGFTPGTGATAGVGGTIASSIATTPYGLSGLSAGTAYSVYVRQVCPLGGYSANATVTSFTTNCIAITTFPSTETFATHPASVCWSEGDLGDLTAGPTTVNSSASSWIEDGFLNSGTTGAVKINIDAAADNDWIITPYYTIPASGYIVKYSVGATNWNATTAVTNWEADDFVQLLVSTSNTNWTVLKTYNASNVPSNLGQIDQTDLSAYSGQTVHFAFRGVEGASNGAADLDFFIDNFIVELPVGCTTPTALASSLVFSSVTTTSLSGSFTAASPAPSKYLVVRSTSATAPTPANGTPYTIGSTVLGAGTNVRLAANTTSFTDSGLTAGTQYYYHVFSYNDSCAGEPFYSATAYTLGQATICSAATSVANNTVTNNSANITWTGSGSYIVEYGASGFTPGTGATAGVGGTIASSVATTPYGLSGLSASTAYSVYVRQVCPLGGYSANSTVTSFTTACNAITTFPSTEPFTTYLPTTCWREGDLGDLTAGPTTIGASVSDWTSDGFLNSGTTGAAKMNIDQANGSEWLISPFYAIPSNGYSVKYSVGATQYNGTGALTTAWESDDFVELLVSTSNANWTVLKTYNASNVPSNLGQIDQVDLSAYNGQTVQFAFRAFEGASNGSADIDFFIDNFIVEFVPDCTSAVGGTGAGGNSFCVSNTSALTLTSTGFSTGTGSTYQWFSSTVVSDYPGAGTGIGSASTSYSNLSLAIGAVTTTTYYWLKVTCPFGTGTDNSSMITVTINPSVATITGASSKCANDAAVTLTETGGTGTSWLWSPGGQTTQSISVNPASTTSYTVQVTSPGSCVLTSSSFTLTVKPNPSAVTVSPNTATICSGQPVGLLASGGTIGGLSTVTSGAGTSLTNGATTLSTLGPNPLQTYYGGIKQQMLFTSAELTALGIVNGTVINSVAFNLAAAETRTLLDYVVKMKNTGTTAFASTTFETGLTTVRNAASVTPAVGWNTLILDNSFTYTGGGLLIEVTQSNNDAGGDGGTTAYYSTTAFASTLFYRGDNATPSTVDAVTTASFAAYTQRNNIQLGINNTVSPTWSWSPNTSDTTASVSVSPLSTQTYTATATVNGCTNFNTSEVTVSPNYTITATAGSNGSVTPTGVTTVCSGGGQAYAITPDSGYNIVDVLVGGVSQGAITSYTFTGVTSNQTISATFAPSCTPVALESASATINPVCADGGTTLTYSGLTGTGASVIWSTFNDGTGDTYGTGTPSEEVGPGTYYAYATGDCGSPVSIQVIVEDGTPAAPTGSLAITNSTCVACSVTGGSIAVGSVSGTGGTLEYSTNGGSSWSATLPTYAAPQTILASVLSSGGCRSTSFQVGTTTAGTCTPVTAGITNNSGTTVLSCSQTSINVTATGGTGYSWNGGATPGTAANSFTTAGTYTVTVTNADGCSDTEQITVTGTVSAPSTWYLDADGDRYITLSATSAGVSACSQPAATAPAVYRVVGGAQGVLGFGVSYDCNDAVAAINPGATEICFDNIDNDCNGSKFNGCTGPIAVTLNSVFTPNFPLGLISTTIFCDAPSSASVQGNPVTYVFEITNTISGAVASLPRNIPTFNLTMTNIYSYNTVFSIRVKAIVNGEDQGYVGATKTVLTPSIPAPSLITTQCNQTLPNIGTFINSAYVYNANLYEFTITSSSFTSPSSVTFTRNTYDFRLSMMPTYTPKYNTVYNISVRARVTFNGSDFWSAPSTICSVTTPLAPATRVIPAQCNADLPSINTAIEAVGVLYATQYQFKVAKETGFDTNEYGTPVELTASSSSNIRITTLTGTVTPEYGRRYQVWVRAGVPGSSGTIWGTYETSPCIVRTPAAPTVDIAVSATDCQDGFTPATPSTLISCNAYTASPVYRYIFIIDGYVGSPGITVDYHQEVQRTVPNVSLSMFTGLESEGNYSIRVALIMVGSPIVIDEGRDCKLINFTGKTIVKEPFKATAYPNPFASNFMIDLKTSSQSVVNLKVYDMLGRMIEQHNVTMSDIWSTTIGDRYPSGVYNVVVSQDDSVQTVRVVKR